MTYLKDLFETHHSSPPPPPLNFEAMRSKRYKHVFSTNNFLIILGEHGTGGGGGYIGPLAALTLSPLLFPN